MRRFSRIPLSRLLALVLLAAALAAPLGMSASASPAAEPQAASHRHHAAANTMQTPCDEDCAALGDIACEDGCVEHCLDACALSCAAPILALPSPDPSMRQARGRRQSPGAGLETVLEGLRGAPPTAPPRRSAVPTEPHPFS